VGLLGEQAPPDEPVLNMEKNPAWVSCPAPWTFYLFIAINYTPAQFKLLAAGWAFVFIDRHSLFL